MSRAVARSAGTGLTELVRTGFRIIFAAMLLLAIGWMVGNLRQVPADSRAVVQRFGQVERVQDAGLVLAWPSPIERVTLLPAWDYQLSLKVVPIANSGPTSETDFMVHQPDDVVSLRRQKDAQNGQYFLTGDGSVVQFDATLHYRITDPGAYVLAQDHVAAALQRLYRASALTIAAAHDLDDFLVARPEEVDAQADANGAGHRQALRDAMVMEINRRLASLRDEGGNLGVEITRIDLVALLPPLAKAAFNDVLTATQVADQTEAAARTDAERTLQEAQRARDAKLAEAVAAADEQQRLAATETADIGVLHAQITQANRDSQLSQYYRDRIGTILGKAGQVTAVDASHGQLVILPGPDQ